MQWNAEDGRYRVIFSLAAFVFVADQLTKLLVVAFLPFNHSATIIPGCLDLVHVLNRGAAFGFLNRHDIDWQFWLFLMATLLAAGLILHMARTMPGSRKLFIGFGLILGGAFGNLADRVRLRAVVDFLDFYVGAWHWPAFNVADVAICLGTFMAALALWRIPASAHAGAREKARASE